MLRFFCGLTGTDYKLLLADTPQSKSKVSLLGSAMLVPIILWIIIGFLLTNVTLQKHWVVSLLAAGICGLLIYIVERTIVMATPSTTMKSFRITLGVAVAFIGAIAIDEIVFSKDINHQININRKEAMENIKDNATTEFNRMYQMDNQKQILENARKNHEQAEGNVIKEVDGKGSGYVGVGKIAGLKIQKANESKVEFERAKIEYDNLIAKKPAFVASAVFDAEKNYEEGILIRVKTLFTLVFSDLFLALIYLAFTIIMFCLEFLVILIKSNAPETNYDRKIKLIEEIGKRRMELLSGLHSPLTDPGFILPQAKAARNSLGSKTSMFS